MNETYICVGCNCRMEKVPHHCHVCERNYCDTCFDDMEDSGTALLNDNTKMCGVCCEVWNYAIEKCIHVAVHMLASLTLHSNTSSLVTSEQQKLLADRLAELKKP